MIKFDNNSNYMYSIDNSGKITSNIRNNTNFIQKFSENIFTCLRVGNESSIHFKIKENNFSIEILIPIEDMIKSFNDIKNNTIRFNEISNQNEKAKPSVFTLLFVENVIKVDASGPNEQNKTKTISTNIDKKTFIEFVKSIVKDYKKIVEFETFGNKIDRNKHEKQIKKLDKFIEKEI